MQAQIERVAPEDVARLPAADDDQLAPGFLGDGLEAGGAHFARRPDREAIPDDEESLRRDGRARGNRG